MVSNEMSIKKLFENLKISKIKKDIRIGVLCGGISSEREISLKTGEGIFSALEKLQYKASFIDFKGANTDDLLNIDIAFLALHGKYGEDGTVQGLLELLKIPYTGSGVLASSLAIDKIFSKKIFVLENIPTPDYISLDYKKEYDLKAIKKMVSQKIGCYPIIVKPSREGSTIGVSIVETEEELDGAINYAGIYDSRILLEAFIKGRNLTVSLLGEKPKPLPIIEIIPKSGFYDFKSKYTAGLTEYIVPAKLEPKTEELINDLAVKTHESLGCYGISRVDFMLDENNNPFILEINTMPGMTSTSLVPKAAGAAGINFENLVEIILNYSSLKL